MSAPKSTVEITPAILRAFAEYLEAGNTGRLEDFASSEAGQTAAKAAQDQKDAELRSLRMGWFRAGAKDFKLNGKVTGYSRDRVKSLLAYLQTLDFDSIPDVTKAEAAAADSAPAE